MSKKLYEEDNIQEIASAIREKNEEGSGTPSSETYRVMDMAPAIRALPVINPSDYRKAADQDIIDNAQNTEINTIKTDVNTLKTDVNTLKTDVNDLKTDTGDLKTDVNDLKTDYNNMILAQDTQPDSEYNKVWFDTDADDEYTFPEIDDNNVSANDTWSSEKINTENNTIKTDVNTLKTDVNTLKTDVNDLKTDTGDLKTDVNDLKTDVSDLNLFDFIPGTTQTVNFDTLGKPASIVHTNGTDVLRTDSFVWTNNTVTETRTLANGKYIVMAADLTTLATTISEIQEGT